MPLADSALTTLDRVKMDLDMDPNDTSLDDILTNIINAISEQIAIYCDRTFQYEQGIVEDHPGYGDSFLVLERKPLVQVTNIKFLDGSITPNPINDYEVYNKKQAILYRYFGWIWTATRAANITQDKIPGQERKLYRVTYDGGYVTPNQAANDNTLKRNLPFDVEDACVQAIVTRLRDKGENLNVTRERLERTQIMFSRSGLPQTIKEKLQPYVVVSMG